MEYDTSPIIQAAASGSHAAQAPSSRRLSTATLPPPVRVPERAQKLQASAPASSGLLAAVLDEIAHAVVVVDQARRIVHANRAGVTELGSGRGLRARDGQVEAAVNGQTATLARAVGDAAAGRFRYLLLGDAAARVGVAIMPLRQSDNTAGKAALLFEKSAQHTGLALHFFGAAHGLTNAEHGVLAALCEGGSVGEVARRTNVAENTARTHVRNILAKTGEPSLRRLAVRLGVLPPVCGRQVSVA